MAPPVVPIQTETYMWSLFLFSLKHLQATKRFAYHLSACPFSPKERLSVPLLEAAPAVQKSGDASCASAQNLITLRTLTSSAVSDDDSVAVHGSDIGVGIHADMRDKLFLPLTTGKAKGLLRVRGMPHRRHLVRKEREVGLVRIKIQ